MAHVRHNARLFPAPVRKPSNAVWMAGVSTMATLSVAPSQAQDNAPIAVDRQGLPAPAAATDPHGIQVRTDSTHIAPVLAVGLMDSERIIVRGESATFISYTNYPAFVARSEVRVFDASSAPDAKPLAIIPADRDGLARWTPAAKTNSALHYVYRVYGSQGQFDETVPQELTVLDARPKAHSALVTRPLFGSRDEAAIRLIALSKSVTVTVTGTAAPETDIVRISGQIVPVQADGRFISLQLVDRASPEIDISVTSASAPHFATKRTIKVPRSDWFFVGQADLTFVSNKGKGPAVQVSGDPVADGNHLISRLAFYAKGSLASGWKLTSSVDTGETPLRDIFSSLNRKDPRQLLRRLNSNDHYTTYGDDSTLVEDAPTQGRFYLRVEKDKSSLLVGNFAVTTQQAELAQLDRGLFGAIIDHKSNAATSFGESKVQVTAFASDPGTVPARDEFRGTGGSLYFLKRQDLSVGSERLRIEIRDRDTGLVISTQDLRAQEDYDIDYFQGRITLLRPLASTAGRDGTVRQGNGSGPIPVLVARYEYTPAVTDLKGYTLGGRGAGWMGSRVRFGVTAQRETTDSADQTVLGADMLIRLHAGTYLKAEIAQTRGPAFGQSNSVDGGLSFNAVTSPGTLGQKAQAYRVETTTDLAEIVGRAGKLSGYYEHFDAGFAANSHLTHSMTDRWGVAADLALSNSSAVSAKLDSLKTEATGRRIIGTADYKQKLGSGFDAALGLRLDTRSAGRTSTGAETGKRTDAAMQIGYTSAGKNWSLFGFGQVTLDRDGTRRGNNRYGVGGTAEISDRLSASAEVSQGQGGLGASVQLNRRYGQGSEAYIGYGLLTDRTDTGLEPVNLLSDANRGNFTVGARHRFSSALSVFGENRVGHGGSAPSLTRSYGVKFDPSPHWSFTGSFENGRIDDPATGLLRRTAATIGAAYSSAKVQIGSTAEGRFETGSDRNQRTWLFRNTASIQLSPDWRALGRLNFAVSNDNQADVRAADFVEAVAGFAYRPVQNDRLNLLARYSYLKDMGPVGQITSGGQAASPKQQSQIISIDANYDLTRWFTLGAKFAARQGRVSLDRTSAATVSSNTALAVLRGDIRIVKKWDGVLEGRLLTNGRAQEQRWGGLAAVYRHLGPHMKIGVGYSIADFSDDLSDQSYSSKGYFLNLLGKF